jgi:hypothetical protein
MECKVQDGTVNNVMKETFDMKRLQEMLEDSQSESPLSQYSQDALSVAGDSEVHFVSYSVIVCFLVLSFLEVL